MTMTKESEYADFFLNRLAGVATLVTTPVENEIIMGFTASDSVRLVRSLDGWEPVISVYVGDHVWYSHIALTDNIRNWWRVLLVRAREHKSIQKAARHENAQRTVAVLQGLVSAEAGGPF